MRIIHLISGPRNISTALMYAFRQRKDTAVIDEPFYAHYLVQSGAVHPGREEVLKSQSTNPAHIWDEIEQKASEVPLLFVKDMGHHFVLPPAHVMEASTYLILLRHPSFVIASFSSVVKELTLRDIGIADQNRIFDQLKVSRNQPVVMDAAWLLRNPELHLETLCNALGIAFDKAMLNWDAGPKPEDGCWAPFWYANVHKSTGFIKQEREWPVLSGFKENILEDAMPYYVYLHQFALG